MGTADDARIVAYINEVCQQIKFREVHQEVKLELKTHLYEVVDEYLSRGFSENEAVSKAIAQMGSATVVGKQLNRVHKSRPEWSIVTLSLLFVGLGLLSIYFIERQALFSGSPMHLFTRSLVFTIIGAAIAAGLYLYDYRKLEPYSRHIYIGTLLILITVIIFGQSVNGKLFLSVGAVSLDIVGISPLLLSMALAGILSSWDWNQPQKLLQGLLLCVVPLALMWASRSLSACAIYAITCTVIMIASGAGRKITSLLISSLFSVLILSIAGTPYMFQRLTGFISPEKDPLGSGWLSIQLGKLISGSGMFGQGLAQQPKLIPYLHTDFIFSYITFSFGWIAGGVLAALVVMFIIRLAGTAKTVKNNYARLLISGFAAIYAVQFLWNILMNIGLAPITGIGLPFISFGGSQLIFNTAALGLVLSVYRRRNISNTLINSCC